MYSRGLTSGVRALGALSLFYCAGLLFVGALSCSVLENREECPCSLRLDMDDESNYCCDSVTVNLQAEDYSKVLTVDRNDFQEQIVVDVPRTGVQVNIFDSALEYCSGSSGLDIPYGEQCPQVYMFSCSCDTSGEEALCHVRLRKNYCGVSLSFVASDTGNYSMDIEGGVCGYDSYGSPLEGQFGYRIRFNDSGNSFFCLPRQDGQALYLNITSLDTGASHKLSLGSYIIQSGYDWTKEDLDDIAVNIDYASLDMKISVNGWETVVDLDVVI